MLDMRFRPPSLDAYLARLEALPFVDGVRLARDGRVGGQTSWEARVELQVGRRTHRFFVEHQSTPRLNYALLDSVLARVAKRPVARWILFTPHVTSPMAAYLQKRGVNYMDAAGNCHVVVGKRHVAVVEGKRPERIHPARQRIGSQGYRVAFALLARRDLVGEPVRTIAEQAGVGKSVVAITLRRLEEDGILLRSQAATRLLGPDQLLDRWLTGYADVLRPRLFLGAFRTQEAEPADLERRLRSELERPTGEDRGPREGPFAAEPDRVVRWAWGGATAAYRLTGHYRARQLVLHLEHLTAGLTRALRLVPAREGQLLILGVPGPLAFQGAVPHTVHPVLVYSELLASLDERAHEAAAEIRRLHLGG